MGVMLLCLVTPAGCGALAILREAEDIVRGTNACALPGCTLKFDTFVPVLQRAMSRGYVRDAVGHYVIDGLRNGFSIGLAPERLKGQRVFANFKSAYEQRDSISDAIERRIHAHKTLDLGPARQALRELREALSDFFVFPMGAVPKPHDATVFRPISDHTKTGLNAATILGILKHSLDTYNEICWFLKKNYFMYVSDVEDAFLIVPLAPWLWVFFLFRWYRRRRYQRGEHLLAHIFGDFGTSGLPGTFKLLFVDCIVQMARSEMVLTLPLPVYVDDTACIGPDAPELNGEMKAYSDSTL